MDTTSTKDIKVRNNRYNGLIGVDLIVIVID